MKKSKFLALILSIIMLVSCVNFVVLAEDGADHFHTEDCCVQEVSMNDVCCEEEHLHEHTTEIDSLLVEEIDDEVENNIVITPIVPDDSTERRLTFAETTDTFYTLIDFEDSSIILKDPVTKNETVIYNGIFNDAVTNGDDAYLAVNNQIIKISESGEQVIIYTGISNISDIAVYNEIIYFIENGTLYSLIPGEATAAQLYITGDVTELDGVSTTKVMWKIRAVGESILSKGEQYTVDNAEDFYFLYDSEKNVISTIEDYEYYEVYNDYIPDVQEDAMQPNYTGTTSTFSTTIHGVSLPLTSYPASGTYFNNTASTDPDIPGDEACVDHGDNNEDGAFCRTYDNASQCYGFAAYIYNEIWGSLLSSAPREYVNATPSGVEDWKNILSDIPLGSHIRMGNDHHSVILLAVNDDNFIVYQANATNDSCGVSVKSYAYSNYNYGYISFYEHPNANNSCSHTNSTIVSYAAEGHTVHCSNCECNYLVAHNFSAPVNTNNSIHTKTCQCGYTTTENHSTTYVADGDSSEHTYRCACGYETSSAHIWSYTTTADKHTKYCTTCNFSMAAENHNYGTTGTSAACRQCIVCYYVATASHNMLTYSNGANGHYTKCSVCNYQTSTVAHSLSYSYNTSTHYQYCSYCTYATSSTAHTMNTVNAGSSGHYTKCTYCPYKTNTTAHNTSTVSAGSSGHYTKCSVCSYQSSTVSHSLYYSNQGSSGHKRLCNYCTYSTSTSSHSLSYDVYYAVGTSSICRRRTVSCDYCSYSYTEYDYSHNYISGTNTCLSCGYKK